MRLAHQELKGPFRASPSLVTFTLDFPLDSPTFVGKATMRARLTVTGTIQDEGPPITAHYEATVTREVTRVK